MKKSNYLSSILILITLLVSSATRAEEHLPISGKSYTIGNGSAVDWTHKYETLSFAGVPDKLSFSFAYIYTAQSNIGNPTLNFSSLSSFAQAILGIGGYSDERKGVGNTHMLYVEESPDGNNWSTIWTDDDATDKKTRSSGDIQLSKSTRHIRFHHSCNFSNSYTNISITELKYLEDPDPANIDFGTAIINSGKVTKTTLLNWCNIAPLTVTSSNPRFTVTPTGFGNIDQYGSQVLTVAYTHTDETGTNNGDITVTNGTYTKTIHVSATTAKRQQTITWNSDLAATGFAMNIGEQYPDEGQVPVLATATSGGRITFTSDNANVIAVVADTALLAKGIGTAHITAHQAGDDEYQAVSATKSFVVTPLQKQSISWEQNLYGLLTTSEPVLLTATATSGGEIVYTSADESVVTISGNTLTVAGEGETYITATQAGFTDDHGIEWLAVSQNNYVVVRNPASQCNGLSLSQSSLTLNGSKKSQDYSLSGIPNILTFTAKHGTKTTSTWGSSTYSALIVEQYAHLNNLWDWYPVYNQVVGTDDTQSGNISLAESATKLRFRTLETGTDHTISNIRVTRQKFMRTDVEAVDIDIEAHATWTKTFTISHSNIDLMTVVAKQGLVALSASTLGAGCEDFGDDAFEASFTPMQKYVHYYDTIVITDGKVQPSTIEIPVHFYSRGLTQSINDFNLPEAALTTDEIVFSATATSGLEVVYLSSDSTIAYVENNQLVILSAGIVDITAYQEGNDRYNSVEQTKTVVISLAPVAILTAPTASNIAIGHPLGESRLTGGEANVAGTFAWAHPELLPELGTAAYEVVFAPDDSLIYAGTSLQVELTVQAEEIPATYGEYEAAFCQGDSVQFAGVWYNVATQTDVLLDERNAQGGDSIVHLTLTVKPTYLIEDSLAFPLGQSPTWQGINLGNMPEGDTTLVVSYESSLGCDSTHVLHLTVLPMVITYGEYEAAFCQGDSVQFAGVWYNVATQTDVLLDERNAQGGDSIVHLTLTVKPTYLIEDSLAFPLGQSPTWQGISLGNMPEGDTTLVVSYESSLGCDSTHVLHLTVLPMVITYGEYEAAFCQDDSVQFAGVWYNVATQTDVLLDERNAQGGDSIVHLTLTVKPTYLIEDSLAFPLGQSPTWQGISLGNMPEGDTTLVVSYESSLGCDSTHVLHLTVLPMVITYGEYEAAFCQDDSVQFAGVWYNVATQTDVLLDERNAQGGDSIVHLTLTVKPTYLIEDSLAFPLGQSPTWQGIQLGNMPEGDTTLIVSYESSLGCDSTHVLHLTVLPMVITYGEYEAAFCEDDSVQFAGVWYNVATQTDVLLDERNAQGGDSIVHLTLTVKPTYLIEDSLAFPLGQSPTWQGINLGNMPEGDTTLVVSYESSLGCDSTHVLHLTVLPMIITYGNDTVSLCAGERYVYEGKSYRHTTVDSVKVSERNQFGGDSIVELVVYVFPVLRVSNSMTITEGDSATWQDYDLSLMPVGDTTLVATYTSIHGCDSVYTLELTVLEAEKMALDELDATQAAEKFFRNGELYIRKNNRVYNLQGIKVETIE